jgi:ubiquinone/menaquinone biosynthesis C-methylase UbiE
MRIGARPCRDASGNLLAIGGPHALPHGWDMPVTANNESKPPPDAAWNAAADRYTDPALSFTDYFGSRIIERLALRPGAQVLDVCCGAGAVAIPAAAAVGRRGHVVGVDSAERLLQEARRRAAEAHLANITWRADDLSHLSFRDASFDAVVCAFGIYYAPDVKSAAERLWNLVRPGGRLLIASWGERLFEPANSAFWDAVRKVRPALCRASNQWDAVGTPERLADLLASAGVPGGSISDEPYEHPLLRAEDWWTIVLGTHYREVVDELAPVERDVVQALTLKPLAERRVEWINASALFATARK